MESDDDYDGGDDVVEDTPDIFNGGDDEQDEDDDAAEADADAKTDIDEEEAENDVDEMPDYVEKAAPVVKSMVDVFVDPEDYYTPDILSRFETTEVSGVRATQIEEYNNPMIKSNSDSPIAIAREELAQRMNPLVIRRVVGDIVIDGRRTRFIERWSPNIMTHLHFQ